MSSGVSTARQQFEAEQFRLKIEELQNTETIEKANDILRNEVLDGIGSFGGTAVELHDHLGNRLNALATVAGVDPRALRLAKFAVETMGRKLDLLFQIIASEGDVGRAAFIFVSSAAGAAAGTAGGLITGPLAVVSGIVVGILAGEAAERIWDAPGCDLTLARLTKIPMWQHWPRGLPSAARDYVCR